MDTDSNVNVNETSDVTWATPADRCASKMEWQRGRPITQETAEPIEELVGGSKLRETGFSLSGRFPLGPSAWRVPVYFLREELDVWRECVWKQAKAWELAALQEQLCWLFHAKIIWFTAFNLNKPNRQTKSPELSQQLRSEPATTFPDRLVFHYCLCGFSVHVAAFNQEVTHYISMVWRCVHSYTEHLYWHKHTQNLLASEHILRCISFFKDKITYVSRS